MRVRILSILQPFEAPRSMAEVIRLERELADLAIAESRREGTPRGHRLRFEQVLDPSGDAPMSAVRLDPTTLTVILAPPSEAAGRAVVAAVGAAPVVVLHQNLEPATAGHARSFRLGVGSRLHKAQAAAALLMGEGHAHAAVVSSDPPACLLRVATCRVTPVTPPANASGVARCVEEILSSTQPDGVALLECGGALNRAIARQLDGRRSVVFLNGNPDPSDAAAASVREIVGMLPDRIGGGLAAAVAQVLESPEQADLDTAGMLAWRIDAVRLVIETLDRLRAPDAAGLADALCAAIAARDGRQRVFRGWHRPMWFDADRRNACLETVVGSVDPVARRRQTAPMQVVPRTDGSFERSPSLAADVDLVEVGAVDEAKGTFEAEALVHLASDRPWSDAHGPDCVRVLNAVGLPEWRVARGLGAGVYTLRGTFRLDPDLVAYPFDTQLLTIRLAADGAHAGSVMRPLARGADIDCACTGWRVVGGHRGVTWSARPSMDGRPAVVQGMEFGVRLRRARRDVALRVGLPLALLLVIAMAALLAGSGHADMVAGILASLFLSAVALYFAEPKPAPGARTLIDAVYVRAFVLFSLLLVGVLVSTRLSTQGYEAMLAGMAVLMPVAVAACLFTLRGAVGRWRWRRLRR